VDSGDVVARALHLLRVGGAALVFAAALPLHADELSAQSSDGRWTLRADNAARILVASDTHTGAIVRRIAVADRRGVRSRVALLLDAPPRASFIALLADVPEAWELPYDPHAEPVYEGLVHDYRMGEGVAASGPLPVRRIVLDAPMTHALFAPNFAHLVGAVAGGKLHIVNLNVRRRIETIDAGGDPQPARGAVWQRDQTVFLIPDGAAPRLLLLDASTWHLRQPLALPAVALAIRVTGDTVEIVTASGVVQFGAGSLHLD
jgi:hypothetical protein